MMASPESNWTGYPSPPPYAYRYTLSDIGYRWIWKLHKASTTPLRIIGGRLIFRVGIGFYQADRTVRTYNELRDHFFRVHEYSFALNNNLRLEDHQIAALLSLEETVGQFGLAASKVVWLLNRGEMEGLEEAWTRYSWPDGVFSRVEWDKRQAEYQCFFSGYV